MLKDLELISEVPPRYSKTQPKLSYENGSAQALWDVPIYADSIEVRANSIDARIVDKEQKRVLKWDVLGWITAKWKRWKRHRNMPTNVGIEREILATKWNIITSLLMFWEDIQLMWVMQERNWLDRRVPTILQRMQRSVMSSTLNMARSFKILAWTKRIFAKKFFL